MKIKLILTDYDAYDEDLVLWVDHTTIDKNIDIYRKGLYRSYAAYHNDDVGMMGVINKEGIHIHLF